MAYISYKVGPDSQMAWWTCGCGGKAVQRVPLNPGDAELIVPVNMIKVLGGPDSGLIAMYTIMPATISLNIHPADVPAFKERYSARDVMPNERTAINGNVTRPTGLPTPPPVPAQQPVVQQPVAAAVPTPPAAHSAAQAAPETDVKHTSTGQ